MFPVLKIGNVWQGVRKHPLFYHVCGKTLSAHRQVEAF